MRSIISWLRGLLRPGEQSSRQADGWSAPAGPSESSAVEAPLETPSVPGPQDQAMAYLDKVRTKLDKLAEDFNDGTLNRGQFQNLYVHYQREIRAIEAMLALAPASEGWKGLVTEGQSVVIRRQHVARAEGYAIYENESGMPLSTLGQFELDPALLVPMLSSYRSATKEIFGAGMRATEIEDGRWLCFVPGEFTTMLAVFSSDPAAKQLDFLEQLHRHFERANRRRLAGPSVDAGSLLFPHEYFLGHWRR